jgi:iron complex outermembrane receptor protein
MDTEDIGIPIIGNRAASVPRQRYLGDPVNWEIPNEQDRTLLAANWTYELSSDWSLTQRIHREQRDEQQLTFWFAGFDGVDTVDRGIWYVQYERETLATNLDLTGDLQIAGMRHRVLLGVDWYEYTINIHGFSNMAPAVLPPISLSNPTYGVSAAGIRALPEDFFWALENSWTGGYFQDQISLTDNLELLLGGRFDWASTGNSFSSTSLPEAESLLTLNDDEAFTPRAGILYRVSPNMSVYASYTSSFGSNNGRTASGDPIDPEEAEQYELGFKAELLSDAISLTASVFELTKSNLLTPDLSTPDPDDVVAIGEVRNRGFELDISGKITESLGVVASYAYNDAEVTLDNSGIQGNRLRNIPRNAASLWAVYDVSPGAEAGLEFGAGVYAIGEREGDAANSWQMPGYERVDAMLAYRTRVADVPVRFQVNVQNLFDKTYIDRGSSYAQYGSPRSVIGSFRVDF